MKKLLTSLLLVTACCLLTACMSPQITTSATTPSSSWIDQLLHPNLWQTINRAKPLDTDIQQPGIQEQLAFYQRHPNYITKLTHNAEPYLYYIYQQTHARNMPVEIALLPMVESNYNPFLYSKQGATGLWQIMPGTASGFHLDINWWYDGRRDIIASTTAALDYLDYLHTYFNDDWLLAIAAYNCGEGTVQHAIKHNKQLNKPTDFWALSLPYQTKQYVPKLLAIAYTLRHANQYNITLPNTPNQPYFQSLPMTGQIDFDLIAKLSGTDTQTIRMLNPGFRRFATAPSEHYDLLLPVEKADIFSTNLNNNKQQRVNWRHYTVKSGDTLGHIANLYNTKTNILMRVNKLTSPTIQPKQDLLIPLTSNQKFNPTITTQQGNITEDHVPGPQQITYTVQAGDTLASIAHRYHVTTGAIQFWNNLTPKQALRANQSLTLWLEQSTHTNTKPITYTVKAGDSLSTIAHRYHTTTTQLKSTNHLTSDIIKVNQRLYVSPTTTAQKRSFIPKSQNEMIIHTVNPGENLSGIAHYYHVTLNQINQWNHLNINNTLKVGQKIHIYPQAVSHG